jgi:hydroxymethylpyrimidine/phosphomethylpyrimidine kinase
MKLRALQCKTNMAGAQDSYDKIAEAFKTDVPHHLWQVVFIALGKDQSLKTSVRQTQKLLLPDTDRCPPRL